MATPVDALQVAIATNAAKYIAAGICMGIGGIGTALGQGYIGGKACESIGNRPESAKAIRESSLFALVFAETSSLFAFVVSLLLLFVVS